MDHDRFEERAAIMEFDGGMDRFEAETLAAREQGKQRWEAIGHVARRVVSEARHQREAMARQSGTNHVPELQPHTTKENRPVFERNGNR